jgi:hypothetical protein
MPIAANKAMKFPMVKRYQCHRISEPPSGPAGASFRCINFLLASVYTPDDAATFQHAAIFFFPARRQSLRSFGYTLARMPHRFIGM